jgi:hypothetical protein
MGFCQVISKEARRGGENGPELGDKDPDGEAGRSWSPASQGPHARFCFFKRLPTLRLFLFALQQPFFIEAPSYLHLPIPGPCQWLRTGQASKSVLRGDPTKLPHKADILKALSPSAKNSLFSKDLVLFLSRYHFHCVQCKQTVHFEDRRKGKLTRALSATGRGADMLSLPRRWAYSRIPGRARTSVCVKEWK